MSCLHDIRQRTSASVSGKHIRSFMNRCLATIRVRRAASRAQIEFLSGREGQAHGLTGRGSRGSGPAEGVAAAGKLFTTAARTLLKPRTAKEGLEFFDFQSAIFCLVFGQEYEQAARSFVYAVPALLSRADYDLVRLLLLVLNGDQAHAKIKSKFLKWQLLTAELMFRLKDSKAAREPEVPQLIMRLRRVGTGEGERALLFKITILGMLASIRTKRFDQTRTPTRRTFSKLVAPVVLACRLLLKARAFQELRTFLGFFEFTGTWLRPADLSALRNVLLRCHESNEGSLSPYAIDETYTAFALGQTDANEAADLLSSHLHAYRSSGFAPGAFSAMHGLALIEHERKSNYARAQEIPNRRCPRHALPRICQIHHPLAST